METVTTSAQPKKSRRRVLLKLSGEVFGGGKLGVDPDTVRGVAKQIAAAVPDDDRDSVSYTHLTLPTTERV